MSARLLRCRFLGVPCRLPAKTGVIGPKQVAGSCGDASEDASVDIGLDLHQQVSHVVRHPLVEAGTEAGREDRPGRSVDTHPVPAIEFRERHFHICRRCRSHRRSATG
jgi:hypothetical protein